MYPYAVWACRADEACLHTILSAALSVLYSARRVDRCQLRCQTKNTAQRQWQGVEALEADDQFLIDNGDVVDSV